MKIRYMICTYAIHIMIKTREKPIRSWPALDIVVDKYEIFELKRNNLRNLRVPRNAHIARQQVNI